MTRVIHLMTVLLATILAVACGNSADADRAKINQIRVWEDQSWTANGRLTSYLSDRSEKVRERAVLALARVNDTLALDSLKRTLLSDPSADVREMAAFALSSWTWKLGKDALIEALPKERDPEVLVAILHSLARLYAREEYEQYFPFLRHPDPRVRAQAALTLDMVFRRESADSIIPLLADPDNYVRIMGMQVLARMNSESAAGAGLEHVDDPDPVIRALAYRLVGSVRFPERNATILSGMADTDPAVRIAIADALIAMKDTAVTHAVLSGLDQEQSISVAQRILRAYAEHTHGSQTEVLADKFSHPDPTVRVQLVTALCNRRDVPCWDLIAPAATDPDWRVRLAYFDAITKVAQFNVPDSSVFETMRPLLDDPNPRVRAKALEIYVSHNGPDAFAALARLYNDSSDYVRGMAINLIGSLHVNLYVDSLYQLYTRYSDDPNPEIKWAITAASANMLPSIQIDSLRQDIINWGLADPNRLVRWYTIAVAHKFRQDRRNELGVFLTDLTPENIESVLPEDSAGPIAEVKTTRGTVTIQLDTKWAPRTVRQFVRNAQQGAYDNTPLNELQAGQMIVLGDRDGTGSNLPPPNVRDEYSPLRVEPGTVMWSITSRDSGRGIFMIALSRLVYQDWRFPVFGKVVDGLDVARSLTLADTIRTVQIIPAGVS